MNHHAIHPSRRYLFTIVLRSISENSTEWNCLGNAFTVSTVGNLGQAHREG